MSDGQEGLISTWLEGRVALVTGGSRGIGRATCLALAARGASVAIHYNASADAANALAQSIISSGGRAVAVQADLGSAGAADALVAAVAFRLGEVDILVNNAGEMSHAPVAEMTDDVWERALAVNLTSVFRCTRAVLPPMQARGWGRIINVSSQAAYTGSVNHAHYAAAKSGLQGFTYSLAKEVGAAGITANLVSPGRIVTDMIRDALPKREEEWLKQTPLKRLGEPEEVASVIGFLASEGARYVTGANIHVNGGLVMG